MKIRTIFILFNGVIVFFLAIIGSLAFMGASSLLSAEFWVLAAVCLAVLVALDIYYIINGKLLAILEKDDWPAVVQHLETKILSKGRYSAREVGLLAQSYLILSDTASIINLENKTAVANPKLVEKHALLFGAARLLEKNISGAVNFFYARIHARKPNKRDLLWNRFYYGFALLLSWRFSEAADEFLILTKIAKNTTLTALSAWFLFDYLSKSLPDRRAEIAEAVTAARKQIRESVYDLREWEKKTLKMRREAHLILVYSYLIEAGKWLFAE